MQYSFFALFIILVSCNSNNQDTRTDKDSLSGNSASTNSTYQPRSGLDLEPSLEKTDSLEIIYYDDPDGDSLRYSRFYTYTATADSTTINELIKGLRQPFQFLDQVRQCRSEGKMHLYQGEQPLKTIYFSTKSGNCNYIYFIKDGSFVYLNLPEGLGEKITESRGKSRKP